MLLDTLEPDVVLGWEVLEYGTVTDKEMDSSLLVTGKETGLGLVNTIVGVFNRG